MKMQVKRPDLAGAEKYFMRENFGLDYFGEEAKIENSRDNGTIC